MYFEFTSNGLSGRIFTKYYVFFQFIEVIATMANILCKHSHTQFEIHKCVHVCKCVWWYVLACKLLKDKGKSLSEMQTNACSCHKEHSACKTRKCLSHVRSCLSADFVVSPQSASRSGERAQHQKRSTQRKTPA